MLRDRHFLIASFIGAALFFVQSSPAQITSGIRGTVTDPSGAAVPGVRITATNVGTGFVATATSSSEGTYTLAAAANRRVPPGDRGQRLQETPAIFWNGSNGFFDRPVTWLPTIGPHMMSGIDVGNLYTSQPVESYQSESYDCGALCIPKAFAWEGKAPFQAFLSLELRGAETAGQMEHSQWREVCARCVSEGNIPAGEGYRWWQYRAVLHTAAGWGPQFARSRSGLSDRFRFQTARGEAVRLVPAQR